MTPPLLRRVGRLLRELKRRKVYQVTAVYVVLAVGVLEILDLLVPTTTLPSWASPLVLNLAIVGLPIVLVLAWTFDVTPTGSTPWSPKPVATWPLPTSGSATRRRPGPRRYGSSRAIRRSATADGWRAWPSISSADPTRPSVSSPTSGSPSSRHGRPSRGAFSTWPRAASRRPGSCSKGWSGRGPLSRPPSSWQPWERRSGSSPSSTPPGPSSGTMPLRFDTGGSPPLERFRDDDRFQDHLRALDRRWGVRG